MNGKNDPESPEDDMNRLRDAAKRNAEAITGSAVFVCLFSKSMLEDPISLMQMGIAVYADKPIYILVEDSRVLDISENLRRMARGLEVYKADDEESFNQATLRLMDAAGMTKEKP